MHITLIDNVELCIQGYIALQKCSMFSIDVKPTLIRLYLTHVWSTTLVEL